MLFFSFSKIGTVEIQNIFLFLLVFVLFIYSNTVNIHLLKKSTEIIMREFNQSIQ